MLFKDIVIQYGKSVAGAELIPHMDPIHAVGVPELTKAFRQDALDDITAAKVYLLDGAAAGYADSFREDLQDFQFDEMASAKIGEFMETVELPAELVWVEYDHRLLMRDRFNRGHIADPDFTDPDEFGLRGFLFDNREKDRLRVKLFRSDGMGRIIDPLYTADFEKGSTEGQFSIAKFTPHAHVTAFYQKMGVSSDTFREIEKQERGDLTYEMVLGFVLFALLSSPGNGVVLEDRATLSPKEEKTAKKFNKPWMTELLRSHVTIRIGKEAEAHLAEQRQRRSFEEAKAVGRLPPTEHWVSEHERRYSNGKIVKIKAYKRGIRVPDSVPTIVMGPRHTDNSASE